MKLTFLGTRGEIDIRTRLHRMHASLQVSWSGRNVMIDCGADWLQRIGHLRPGAILLTHAHPDHAWGLRAGAPCPVYATEQTWNCLDHFPVKDRVCIQPRTPFQIHRITCEAFPVEHSIRAPAVGFRITAGRSTTFYVPDVLYIHEPHEALGGIRMYVGDGASLLRPIVRKVKGALVGHAAIRTQLGWCGREGIPRALITHCGSEIVSADARTIERAVRDLGRQNGVDSGIASDGLEILLP